MVRGDMRFKRHILVVATLSLSFFLIYVANYHKPRFAPSKSPPLIHHPHTLDGGFSGLLREWLRSTPRCIAPYANPNDPVAKEYKKKVKLKCPSAEPYTVIDGNGLITVTKSVPENVECFYSMMWRSRVHEGDIVYDSFEPIPDDGVSLSFTYDAANVSCWNKSERVYLNTHYIVPDIWPSPGTKAPNEAPSVLIISIESLSALAFKRYMPKVVKKLEQMGNVHYMDNFVKIDDNSFPNLIAMLAGQHVTYEESRAIRNEYLDDKWPYIWKDFKRAGYVTGFLEDMANVGLFNFNKKGFQEPPVDWYPHAFWVQMYPVIYRQFEMFSSLRNYKEYCFEKNGSKLSIYLEQIKSFVKKQWQQKQPYFLFAIHAQMTHENSNNFAFFDKPLSDFLNESSTYLEDTIIILSGDHGPRFNQGNTRTAYGRLEERMPLFAIRIPDSLAERRPHLRNYLSANDDRLVSWYDVHRILKDVTEDTYSPLGFTERLRGPLSIWRELVPPNRSCNDTGILPEYCVCDGKIHLSPECPDPWWAAKVLVSHANKLLEQYECGNQTFKEVTESHYLMPEAGKDYQLERIFIKIIVEPSMAAIEGTVQRDRTKAEMPYRMYNGNMNEIDQIIEDTKITRTICNKP